MDAYSRKSQTGRTPGRIDVFARAAATLFGIIVIAGCAVPQGASAPTSTPVTTAGSTESPSVSEPTESPAAEAAVTESVEETPASEPAEESTTLPPEENPFTLSAEKIERLDYLHGIVDLYEPAPGEEVMSAEEEMAHAQCTSLVDVDLVHVARVLPSMTFWTFHLNFKPLLADPDPLNQVGCLRFYWRDQNATPETFVPSDHWELIPCVVHNPTGFTTDAVDPSVSLFTTQGEPADDPYVATFADGAWVQCPFHLSDEAEEARMRSTLLPELGAKGFDSTQILAVETELESIALNHEQEFYLFEVAAATVDRDNQLHERQPLAGYVPACSGSAACAPSWLTYEPAPSSFDIVTYGAGLAGSSHAPADPYAPVDCENLHTSDPSDYVPQQCGFAVAPSEPGRFASLQFGASVPDSVDECVDPASGEFYVQFITQKIGELNGLHCSTPNVAPTPAARPMPFWSGASNITAGYLYSPTEGPSYYSGSMYEIWIDPDSSVRPPE